MSKQEQPQFDPPIDGGVVVGFDGSHRAFEALTWAVAEARLRGLPVHAVRAWKLSTAIQETNVPFGTVPSFEECAEAVDRSLRTAIEEIDTTGVEVHRHVVHGAAPGTLIAASKNADLLVVGRLGIGGFAGLAIGSSAEQVARHAACTVVVVRAQEV